MQSAEDSGLAEKARSVAPPLRMPAADQLGLGTNLRSGEVDWSVVRRRMESLAVTSFHLQRVAGGFRFTCVVAPADGQRRKIEAESENEADAIDQALGRAEHDR